MGNSSPPDDDDDWDDEVARALLNSIVLVGVSYVDPEDSVTDQEQFWGKVISVEQGSAIRLELLGTRVGEKFSLPPSTGGFDRAEPGHYELRGTGEIVVNPDFVSQWRVRKPVS